MKAIITILISCLVMSCAAPAKYVYAPAKITVYKGRITVQPLQKFKPMPDTVIYGTQIKRL